VTNEPKAKEDTVEPLVRLLPCPFCGGEARFVTREQCVADRDVRCGTPGCFLEYGADWWIDPRSVAEMWNRRPNARNHDSIEAR
jgi:hypothetical protein